LPAADAGALAAGASLDGGVAGGSDGRAWLAGGLAPLVAVPVTVWAAASTAEFTAVSAEGPTALVTAAAALPSGLPDPAPLAADPAAGAAPGCPSPVAAWACLEKSKRSRMIPAAAIANCAARTATRYASSCDIDSSHPQAKAG
jgi:hypothetical protein